MKENVRIIKSPSEIFQLPDDGIPPFLTTMPAVKGGHVKKILLIIIFGTWCKRALVIVNGAVENRKNVRALDVDRQ